MSGRRLLPNICGRTRLDREIDINGLVRRHRLVGVDKSVGHDETED